MVFPRELNQFSLILAGDLDFSMEGATGVAGAGGLTIPSYRANETSFASARGIQFRGGGVFVNENLVLPDLSIPQSSSRVLPKVAFSNAPLYIGGQVLVRRLQSASTQRFAPVRATGSSWSDLKQQLPGAALLFSSIRMEEKDLGLARLSGRRVPESTPSQELFQQCLTEAKISRDLEMTAEAKSLLKQSEDVRSPSSSSAQFSFVMGLSHGNRFKPVRVRTESQLLFESRGEETCLPSSNEPCFNI